ncbi:MAG: pantoate--beta-alanine ligase [Flavobacteriia bacterium]|nr:pantoate--beta-alanine ligase [Flavobacteriia bacterium]
MIVCNTVDALQKQILIEKSKGKSIGFVPSMGALHLGHISLVNEAQKQCDIIVVSIFVNPTQFNNPDDLLKYPRTLEADIQMLDNSACSIIFAPSVDEIYPANLETINLDLGTLKNVMEDALRPGHFNGVVNVVYRLFDIVKPSKAFFGLKDFQQVAVIKYMTKHFNLAIEIVACPTIREITGLAMSSRNLRLSDKQKKDALIIIQTLRYSKELSKELTPMDVRLKARSFFNTSELTLEYIEIVDPLTLVSLDENWVEGATMCIAAFCGEVRLIDNLQLF